MHRIAIISLIAFILVGCMPYKSSFQCPNVSNGKCVTVEQAYEESIQKSDGKLSDKKPEENKSSKQNNFLEKPEKQTIEETYRTEVLKKVTSMLQEPDTPLIMPPKALRIFIPPYTEGDQLFMSRYIYLIVDDAKWVFDQNE